MNRKTLLTLGLLIVFVLSACTPTESAPVAPPEPTVAETTQEEAPPAPEVTEEETPVAAPAATESPAEEPVALATSRGSDLHATDPGTVNIASGKPQLVEFFAFW